MIGIGVNGPVIKKTHATLFKARVWGDIVGLEDTIRHN